MTTAAPPAATVQVARNRPTRTADYGPAPAGHPKARRQVGSGKARRPAGWSRILRSGSTFSVDAQELGALRGWLEANPAASRDVTVRELPASEASEASDPSDDDEERAPLPVDANGPYQGAIARLRLVLDEDNHQGLSMADLIDLGRSIGLELEGAEGYRRRVQLLAQIRAELGEV